MELLTVLLALKEDIIYDLLISLLRAYYCYECCHCFTYFMLTATMKTSKSRVCRVIVLRRCLTLGLRLADHQCYHLLTSWRTSFCFVCIMVLAIPLAGFKVL